MGQASARQAPLQWGLTNMEKNWKAWAILTDGQQIAWPNLRQGQAKWRFDFLKRGMLYRGVEIKKCGYLQND
jgi:hypothetical protein